MTINKNKYQMLLFLIHEFINYCYLFRNQFIFVFVIFLFNWYQQFFYDCITRFSEGILLNSKKINGPCECHSKNNKNVPISSNRKWWLLSTSPLKICSLFFRRYIFSIYNLGFFVFENFDCKFIAIENCILSYFRYFIH